MLSAADVVGYDVISQVSDGSAREKKDHRTMNDKLKYFCLSFDDGTNTVQFICSWPRHGLH